MRYFQLLIIFLALSACDAQITKPQAIDERLLIGNWYFFGEKAALTEVTNWRILADKTFVTRAFSCASKQLVDSTVKSGTWSINGHIFSVAEDSMEENRPSLVYDFSLNKLTDQTLEYSVKGRNAIFHKRLSEVPYDCTTTKEEIDSHARANQSHETSENSD